MQLRGTDAISGPREELIMRGQRWHRGNYL